MAWQGNWHGKWNGNWHGPVEADPGAMYANLSGSGTVTADITYAPVVSDGGFKPTGGWVVHEQQDFSHLPKPRTAEQLKAERIRLGILEQEKAQIEQEVAAVRQEVPKNGTEQEIQQRIYLALLNEQLAMQEAQEALLMAKLRALEYELEQQALSAEAAMIMEQDMAFCMAMLAVA